MVPRSHAEAHDHDVLIIGAGPAGMATALALRQCGVERVAMLQPPPPRFAPRRPRMVESAAPDLPALLARLGLSLPEGLHPIPGQGSAWGGVLRWEPFARRGLPPAWRLDRQCFDAALLDAAVAAGVIVHNGHLLACDRDGVGHDAGRRAEHGSGHWRVHIEPRGGGGLTVGARWLVDASGRRSVLARHLGATRQRIDMQIGMAASLDLPAATALLPQLADQLFVESCDAGWWYAAPGAAQQLTLCLFSDRDLLRGASQWRAALAASAYLNELSLQVPSRLRLFGHTAESACLDRAAGDRWVAVGDALMSLDPLSSSGVSCALRDGIDCVAQVLLPALAGAPTERLARHWAHRANGHWQHYLQQRCAQYRRAGGRYSSPYWQRRQQIPVPSTARSAALAAAAPG